MRGELVAQVDYTFGSLTQSGSDPEQQPLSSPSAERKSSGRAGERPKRTSGDHADDRKTVRGRGIKRRGDQCGRPGDREAERL